MSTAESLGTPAPPSELAPGSIVGRYELVSRISSGARSSVWTAAPAEVRASGRALHGVAAVKISPANGRPGDDELRELFLNRARLASRVAHPNVARVVDFGTDRGVLFTVTEFVDGVSLGALDRACRERSGTIPPHIALRILIEVCEGLEEAHEMRDAAGQPVGVAHRSLSLGKIMVTKRGVAKLVDLGTVHRSNAIDSLSAILGPPGRGGIDSAPCLAPERAFEAQADREGDLWAVGVVLYRLLTGKLPFTEREGAGVPAGSIDAPRGPLLLPADLHPSIVAVLRVALGATPGERYPTAAQLRDALVQTMTALETAQTTSDDVAVWFEPYLGKHADVARRPLRQPVDTPAPSALPSPVDPVDDVPGDTPPLRVLQVIQASPVDRVLRPWAPPITWVPIDASETVAPRSSRPPAAPRAKTPAVLTLVFVLVAVAALFSRGLDHPFGARPTAPLRSVFARASEPTRSAIATHSPATHAPVDLAAGQPASAVVSVSALPRVDPEPPSRQTIRRRASMSRPTKPAALSPAVPPEIDDGF